MIFLDVLIHIIFTIDVLVNFRTSFINISTGDEITSTREIAKHYFKGRFVIDFLAAFPFEYVALLFVSELNSNWFGLFGLLKLARIVKLNNIITYLNLSNANKTSLRLLQLGLFIFIFIHCLA